MSCLTYSEPADAYGVTTRGLCKRYAGEMVLDRLELQVPEEAVYVLVGANGAGKSTTLKLLMNLERPSAGVAEVFGMDTALQGAKVRAQVGYVPEHQPHQYRWMTCGRLIRQVSSYYPAWDRAYADHLSHAFGLHLDRKVRSLSKGEARRLQLMLALSHRPPLLLLDEPTDGLDPVVRKRALALLAEHLADTPTTVLISTHQINEWESLADHIGVLRKGRTVVQMPLDELRRTVRRYRLAVPDGWDAPADLHTAGLRRSSAGREVQCTVVGEEREVAARLARTGAEVREVMPLGLEDAALAFLEEEVSR